jgi:2-phospho-L-lactate guanylyltransferase
MAEVVIAARGGPEAKSRCRNLVSPADRARLVEAMLVDMLETCLNAPAVSAVHVVTPSVAIGDVAVRCGVNAILEEKSAGLNAAFELARCRIAMRGPKTRLALLPGDLPGLQSQELQRALGLHSEETVVVVPTCNDAGTGALVLAAHVPFDFSFGPGSFRRHIAAAYACRLTPQVLEVPGLSQDLDRPADLQAFLASGPRHSRTYELLRALNLQTGAAA